MFGMKKKGILYIALAILALGLIADLMMKSPQCSSDTKLTELHLGTPGILRFARLDAGFIEKEKAVLSDWGYIGDPVALEIQRNLYTKYSTQIIDRLKEARINWVSLTWSNGFSIEKEAGQRDECGKFIEKCHANGIKVSAYLSMSNMFWKNMFKDVPESKNWVWRDEAGEPRLYGKKPERYLADVSKKEWREYVKKRIRLAIEAGVDAIYLDNVKGEGKAVLAFLKELQQFLGEKNIPLYCNAHVWSGGWAKYNEVCDIALDECTEEPGFDDKKIMNNGKILKFMLPASADKKGFLYEHRVHRTSGHPKRRLGYMSTKGQKLSMAEGAFFGGIYYIATEGIFLKDLLMDEPDAISAWESIGQYNAFLADNSGLYMNLSSLAEVAVLDSYGEKRERDFCDALILGNIIYDVIILDDFAKSDLDRYKILIINASTTRKWNNISNEDIELIKSFVKKGGKLYMAGSCPKLEQALGVNFTVSEKIKNENGIFYKENIISNTNINSSKTISVNFAKEIRDLLGKPLLKIKQSGSEGNYVTGNIVRKDNTKELIVHLLNYSSDFVNLVEVGINLALIDELGINIKNIKVLSPDTVLPKISTYTLNERLWIKLPGLDTYTVVVLGAE